MSRDPGLAVLDLHTHPDHSPLSDALSGHRDEHLDHWSLCDRFNILLGYTGQLSFGHASFYGLGAYGAGLLHREAQLPLVGGNGWAGPRRGDRRGVVIGYLSLRRSDVYFSLLTLAFSQILFFLAFQLRSITGGDDGSPWNSGLSPPLGPLISASRRICIILRLYSLSYDLTLPAVILRSPLGKAMRAVKENKEGPLPAASIRRG